MGSIYPPAWVNQQYLPPPQPPTPGATRHWGGMAPLQGELSWMSQLLAGIQSDPSFVASIGMNPIGAAIPFQSKRRLDRVTNPVSARYKAADMREARMDQMGSAYDYLVEDFYEFSARDVGDDTAEYMLEKIKKGPNRLASRLSREFDLSPDDARQVVIRFEKYLQEALAK